MNQITRLMTKKTKKETIEQFSVCKGSPIKRAGSVMGRFLRKRYLLSFEWKRVGVTHSDSDDVMSLDNWV